MNNFFLSILSKQSKIKKTILTIVTLAFMGWSVANAQVGIGTTTPDAAAVLELTSTTQGFLPPRMTAAQRDAIATPTQGLMVYCTNCGSNGEAQLYNGAAWVNLAGGTVAAVPTPNVTSTTGRIWMDRNLGATQVATSSTDAASYGDLYQWGRDADGHQIRTSNTSSVQSSSTSPGNTFIIDSTNWYTGADPDTLWQGVTGINNPCPSGYRLPTVDEWETEITSWGSGNNTAAGAFASPLKLPMVGSRGSDGSPPNGVGAEGYYWSSTIDVNNSFSLFFDSSSASRYSDVRSYASAVRCIKD